MTKPSYLGRCPAESAANPVSLQEKCSMTENQSLRGSRDELRQSLRRTENCHWLAPDQWCRLAISHRTLRRADERRAGLRGLLDPHTGERFVIEEERLAGHN